MVQEEQVMDNAQRAENDFLAFFHRHLIPMVFVFKKADVTTSFVITTFVLSVQGQWFLVTAGHCLQKVDELKNISLPNATCGIYFLFEKGKIVYVGQSKSVINRLNNHPVKYDRFSIIECDEKKLIPLKRLYIAKFKPKYNLKTTENLQKTV